MPARASWEGVEGPGTIAIVVVPEFVVECAYRTHVVRAVSVYLGLREGLGPLRTPVSIQPFRIYKYSERNMEQHGTSEWPGQIWPPGGALFI